MKQVCSSFTHLQVYPISSKQQTWVTDLQPQQLEKLQSEQLNAQQHGVTLHEIVVSWVTSGTKKLIEIQQKITL